MLPAAQERERVRARARTDTHADTRPSRAVTRYTLLSATGSPLQIGAGQRADTKDAVGSPALLAVSGASGTLDCLDLCVVKGIMRDQCGLVFSGLRLMLLPVTLCATPRHPVCRTY